MKKEQLIKIKQAELCSLKVRAFFTLYLNIYCHLHQERIKTDDLQFLDEINIIKLLKNLETSKSLFDDLFIETMLFYNIEPMFFYNIYLTKSWENYGKWLYKCNQFLISKKVDIYKAIVLEDELQETQLINELMIFHDIHCQLKF